MANQRPRIDHTAQCQPIRGERLHNCGMASALRMRTDAGSLVLEPVARIRVSTIDFAYQNNKGKLTLLIKWPVQCTGADRCGLVSHDSYEEVISWSIRNISLPFTKDGRRLFTVVVFSDTKRKERPGILVTERIAKVQFAPLSENAKIGKREKSEE